MAVSSVLRLKSKPAGKACAKMTPEIYFARNLASNEKKIRDKSLKKLRRWIEARSSAPDAFGEEELFKLWKGLFYCMWMSDKPLIQEDLAETISSLVFSVSDRTLALKFITVALKTMARDWSGIDTWRMDKFLMFIRRIIRKSLEYLAQGGWKEEEVSIYSQMISDCIMNANKNTAALLVPVGLQLHVTNLFPEELAKAGGEDLSSDVIIKMLEPFAKCLAFSQDFRLKKDIRQYVFTYLIKQSDAGIAYDEDAECSSKQRREKINPTKKKKIPSKKTEEKTMEDKDESVEEEEDTAEDIEKEADEKMGDDDDEDIVDVIDEEPDEDMVEIEESNPDWGAKDPRAGGVDVVLPQLNPDYNKLANMLLKLASDKSVRSKNRKAMYHLVLWFRDLSNGVYPLAVDLPVVGDGLTPKAMKKAALQFIKDELKMTKERIAERQQVKKSRKAQRQLDSKAEILNIQMEKASKEKDEENLDGSEGEDKEDLDGSEAEDEENLDGSEAEDEEDDLELVKKNDDDEHLGEKEVENPSNEKGAQVPMKSTKGINKKHFSKSAKASATFEVEDDWDEEKEASILPTAIKQLKRKLKAEKRPVKSDTKEGLGCGELEIVIPYKKYKGAEKLPASITPPETTENNSSNEGNRRVNFVLAKNTAQDPRDYQESLRKSPGVPHDPERQPNGGVLKRQSKAKHQQPNKFADHTRRNKKGLSPRVL